MTKTVKPVTRETSGTVRSGGKDREVLVTVGPANVVGVRLKGERTTFTTTSEALYTILAKQEASHESV